MYGIYITWPHGRRERLGVRHWNKKGSNYTKTYAVWDDKESAQRCADLLMSHSKENNIVKAVVKGCKG